MGKSALLAVPALVERLEDAYPQVRVDAAEVLGAMAKRGDLGDGVELAVPALVRALKGSDTHVPSVAARALGAIGKPAVPALVEALQDRRARALAASVLRDEISSAVPALVRALARHLEDPQNDVREFAAEELGRAGERASPAVPALIGALDDLVALVRLTAVVALGRIGEKAVPALIAALKDARRNVRENAARTLGEMRPPADSATSELERLAGRDPEESVRRVALGALRRMRSR